MRGAEPAPTLVPACPGRVRYRTGSESYLVEDRAGERLQDTREKRAGGSATIVSFKPETSHGRATLWGPEEPRWGIRMGSRAKPTTRQ